MLRSIPATSLSGDVFSRRSANLAAHSGQIAFPGGAVEEGESLEAAAIREAEEEVGIRADAVELIGRLDDLITVRIWSFKQSASVMSRSSTPFSSMILASRRRASRVSSSRRNSRTFSTEISPWKSRYRLSSR